MNLLDQIRLNAKKYQKRIVLPESLEERTLNAADEVIENKFARIILIGEKEQILEKAEKDGLKNIVNAKSLIH